MLVEANSAAEALDYVTTTITHSETPYPAWSDWHGGIGDGLAGRWSGLFDGWEENQDVLCYSENQQLAEEIIEKWIGYRIEEMKLLVGATTDLDLSEVVDNYKPEDNEYNDTKYKLWQLSRLSKLLTNDWNSDTGVYDLHDHTASLEYFRERLTKEPTKQYLVPVDFHF